MECEETIVKIKYGNYSIKQIYIPISIKNEHWWITWRVSKVWNNKKKEIGTHVLGITKHQGYHYKHESFLFDIYVRKMFLPLYGGLNDSIGNQD